MQIVGSRWGAVGQPGRRSLQGERGALWLLVPSRGSPLLWHLTELGLCCWPFLCTLTHCEFPGISSGSVEISWRRGGLACEVAAGLEPQSKPAPWEWISAAANLCALVQGRDQFLQQYFGRICLSRASVLLRAGVKEILEPLYPFLNAFVCSQGFKCCLVNARV